MKLFYKIYIFSNVSPRLLFTVFYTRLKYMILYTHVCFLCIFIFKKIKNNTKKDI